MRLKRAIGLLAIAGCIALAVYLGPILGENFHPIIEGKMFRSAQLDADDLEARAAEVGLASVLSVRGVRPHKAWYVAEQSVGEKLGLKMITVTLSADRMPSRQRLQRLVHALDTAPRPLLLHCQAGVERSGLAAAIAVLLDGQSVEAARGHFSLRYGFHPWLSRTNLPQVLDRYERWLAEAGIESSGDAFRGWVDDSYVAAFYQAQLEIVDFPAMPRAGQPVAVSLRVTNRSPDPMHFRATSDSGVHVGTLIEGVDVADFRREGRSGRKNLDLAPGDSHVFDLALSALPTAGTYRLTVDLVNENVAWFADMGSTVLVREFEVSPIANVATAR